MAKWRADNPELERARKAAYYAAHREAVKAKQARYNAAHVEERRESQRAYYAANRDKFREYQTKYRATKPEARRSSERRRRAAKRGGPTERFTLPEIFERDGWVCGICSEPIDRTLKFPDPMSVHLDHIVPISRGGSHTRDNVQATHGVCNMRKGNRLMGETP